ncbi:histidinol-phosphate aminotransferase family protein [Kitasatospora sp. NBC_01560]|uniref:pyridoxal phosphate-dependent aminotransferase n=1 Tax=Kitasatospora sp. NBC_01560 TaxID=2975965 RepID=UPI0038694862
MIEPNRNVADFRPPRTAAANRVGNIVRLGHNERTAPLPDSVVEEMLSGITPEELTALPELEGVYQKVGAHLGVDRDAVLLCHGADQGINSLFQAYIGPGDEVVYVSPTYHRYSQFCRLYGATAVEIGYDAAFGADLPSLTSSIRAATKLVVLVNPNSLSGASLDLDQITTVVEQAQRHGALVLVDEVYFHYCGVSALPLLDTYDNLVVARSFSKAFGVAGVRVGVMVGAPEVIEQLWKLKPRHEISSVSARIVAYLLDHPEIMETYVASVRAARVRFEAELSQRGFDTVGGESASLLVRLPTGLERAALAADLWKAGYEVSAGLPVPYERYLRITVGPWEQMAPFVEVFTSVVRSAQEKKEAGLRPAER